jgi:hypothetical protein
VTPAALQAPHRAADWDRCAGADRVLIAQDTTCSNFTAHRATQGLGPIESLRDQGILVHSALALTTTNVYPAMSFSGAPNPSIPLAA